MQQSDGSPQPLHQSSQPKNDRQQFASMSLAAKHNLFQIVFEQSPDAIAIADDNGCFVEANPSACQLLGMSRTDLMNRSLADFLEENFSFRTIWQTFLAGSRGRGEICFHRPDGLIREVEYTSVVDFLPHHHLMVLHDITERKQADVRERDRAEAELQRQYQRSQLLSEVTLKIRQSLQLKEILQTTVNEVQQILQADRVLIYQVLSNGTGVPISEAVLPEYPAILGVHFPEEVFPEDYRELYAQGRVQAIVDVHDADAGLAECLVEFVEQWGIQAKLIVPIVQNLSARNKSHAGKAKIQNHLWGLLIAHQCDAPRQWNEFELELLQQLADQIGIALSQAQLLENLEDIVAERTSELREANATLQQEVADRMQAEAALRRSEEQLRLITNALPVLISYVDNQRRYRFNNQAYQDWFGKPPSEILGCHMRNVLGKDFYQRIRKQVNAALAGQIVTYENELLTQDGNTRSVSVTFIPHLSNRKTVKGFFSLTNDISDRKAIERMKDEFISVVSHELRTPLTSIHGSLKLLATGKLGTLSEAGQQMLEVADENTDRLVRLVNNILDLQRIESGKVKMEKQVCNVTDLTIQATEAMQTMAQQHDIKLETTSVPVSIWADPDYMMQTLTNLLSNAIKFSSPGNTIWLTAEVNSAANQTAHKKESVATGTQRSSSPIANVIFQVQDRGQGIPAENLESIFERFHQVDASDSRRKGGTGLGLAICRRIIEQHNGKIWAESTLGEGSTFYFIVPAPNQQERDGDDP